LPSTSLAVRASPESAPRRGIPTPPLPSNWWLVIELSHHPGWPLSKRARNFASDSRKARSARLRSVLVNDAGANQILALRRQTQLPDPRSESIGRKSMPVKPYSKIGNPSVHQPSRVFSRTRSAGRLHKG
jgi:hypothetical protein